METPENNPATQNKHLSMPVPEKQDDWRPKTILLDLATCLLAALLGSFSLFYFSNYNNFAPGGVTGLASIVGNFLHTLGVGETTSNMSILMFAFNAPIFVLVAIFVSRKTGFILIAYMLMQSGLSIQDISERLNFVSQSFFGKYFKQRVGISPSRYRSQGM